MQLSKKCQMRICAFIHGILVSGLLESTLMLLLVPRLDSHSTALKEENSRWKNWAMLVSVSAIRILTLYRVSTRQVEYHIVCRMLKKSGSSWLGLARTFMSQAQLVIVTSLLCFFFILTSQ